MLGLCFVCLNNVSFEVTINKYKWFIVLFWYYEMLLVILTSGNPNPKPSCYRYFMLFLQLTPPLPFFP